MAILYLIAIVTVIIADNCWYWMGYFAHRQSPWFQKLLQQAPDVEHVVVHQPWYGLYFYQFVPYFRMFLPFALGSYRFSPWRWLIITIIGSTFYVGVFLSIGVIGAMIVASISSIDAIATSVNWIIAGIAVVYVLFLYKQYEKLTK